MQIVVLRHKDILLTFDFQRIGPKAVLSSSRNVRLSVCVFVPFPCDFFASKNWCGASLVQELVWNVTRVEP